MNCRTGKRSLTTIVLGLITALSLASTANAQDDVGLFGTWSITGINSRPHPECGATTNKGELRVFQRVTDNQSLIYQGFVSFASSYELCPDTPEEKSEALLIVKGSQVAISYDNPDWYPDMLSLDGAVMEGADSNGTKTRWVKTSGPSDSARAAEVKASIAQREYGAGSEIVRRALLANGHSESGAEDILWKYFDGMADCQVDTLSAMASENSLPFYELINVVDTEISGGMTNTAMYFEFDHRSFDTRSMLCVDTLMRELDLNELLGVRRQATKETESRTVAEPE